VVLFDDLWVIVLVDALLRAMLLCCVATLLLPSLPAAAGQPPSVWGSPHLFALIGSNFPRGLDVGCCSRRRKF
jgi:hypothetical protein